jgi:endogenous inhibitor of DNA gyrase (YacG/DUF329 family)
MPCEHGVRLSNHHINRMSERPVSAGPRCPICGKPAAEKYEPFCGKRCADVDLNRWLSDVYAVPGNAADADEDERPSTKRADEEP